MTRPGGRGLIYIVLAFGIAGVMTLFGMWAEGPLDRIERHIERYRDAPGGSTTPRTVRR